MSRGRRLRRCRPQVPVVEPSDPPHRQYAARRKRPGFYCADAWSVLIQRDVRAVLVVVADVLLAKSEQVGLVQRDHVIQHLAAYALDPSFGDTVLPGAPNPGDVIPSSIAL